MRIQSAQPPLLLPSHFIKKSLLDEYHVLWESEQSVKDHPDIRLRRNSMVHRLAHHRQIINQIMGRMNIVDKAEDTVNRANNLLGITLADFSHLPHQPHPLGLIPSKSNLCINASQVYSVDYFQQALSVVYCG
jgi:hypothetical protein